MNTHPLADALKTAQESIAAQLADAEAQLEEKLGEARALEAFIEEARTMLGSSPVLVEAISGVLRDANSQGMQLKDIAHKINAQHLYPHEVSSERIRMCVDMHPEVLQRNASSVTLGPT